MAGGPEESRRPGGGTVIVEGMRVATGSVKDYRLPGVTVIGERPSGAISSLHMPIEIVSAPVSLDELRHMAGQQFGDFVKAVVDVERGMMAIGGELHADEEALLLQHGARQADLWGINLYPDRPAAELIEFDSMINVRPSQGNRSRGVKDALVRQQIQEIVGRLVVP